jgi:hypothetical protein
LYCGKPPKKKQIKIGKNREKFVFIYFYLFLPIFLSAACRNLIYNYSMLALAPLFRCLRHHIFGFIVKVSVLEPLPDILHSLR